MIAILSVSIIATLFVAVNFVSAQAAANAPTIRSFTGPTELKVGEDGVWKVATSDQDGGQLTYRVRWGDERVVSKIGNGVLSIFRRSDDFVQRTSFTHFYKKSGEYTITITVSDQTGKTTKTTSTVRVIDAPFREARFSVKPGTGRSPLEVVFTVNLGTRIQAQIDFGDNTPNASVKCDQELTDERTTCETPVEVSHTYRNPGFYTAELFKAYDYVRYVKDTAKIRVKTGNPALDFFKGITDAFQGAFDTVMTALFPDNPDAIADREFADLPDIRTDGYSFGTRTVHEIEAIIINDRVGTKVTCGLSTGSNTFQAYIITSTNEIGISDCSSTKDADGYLKSIITNLTIRHAFSGLTIEEMRGIPIYIGKTGEDITEVQDDSDPTVPEEDPNKIGFEVKVKNAAGVTVQNWVQGNLTIKSNDSLSFRWDARTGYSQCLPFLADDGSYAITRTDSKMLTGNTENEDFNIYERAGSYYIECKRTNDSSLVHSSVIDIAVNDSVDRRVEPPTKDQYSLTKDTTNPLKVTVTRKAPAGCADHLKYIGEINWGDDSFTRQPQTAADVCGPAKTLTETHTYKKPGTYRVRVKLNNVLVFNKKIVIKELVDTPTQPGALKVTPGTGDQELSVTLTTNNAAVNKKISECKYSLGFYGPSGNGLSVDWGDGRTQPSDSYVDTKRGQSCTNFVSKHTYQKAGTYTVKLTSWHPGPTDAPITDWKDTATVKVGSADPVVGNVFKATPTSGQAALKVTFRFPSNRNSILTFGDKTKARVFTPCVPSEVPAPAGTGGSAACLAYREVTHTYEKADDYNAKLITGCPISAGTCYDNAKIETIAITVK